MNEERTPAASPLTDAAASFDMPAPAGLRLEFVVQCADWQSAGWPADMLSETKARSIAAAIEAFVEFGGSDGEVETATVAFSDDAAVQALNKQFRGQDRPTNVLSFPAAPVAMGAPTPLGDIILARETVEREARLEDKSFDQHATHLIVHGVLHLAGYDHLTPEEAEVMEALEVDILAQLGINNPYSEELTDV